MYQAELIMKKEKKEEYKDEEKGKVTSQSLGAMFEMDPTLNECISSTCSSDEDFISRLKKWNK